MGEVGNSGRPGLDGPTGAPGAPGHIIVIPVCIQYPISSLFLTYLNYLHYSSLLFMINVIHKHLNVQFME
jgi:hypothetical protein